MVQMLHNPSGDSDPSKTRCQTGYPSTPYPTTLPFDEPACCADSCADISCPTGYKDTTQVVNLQGMLVVLLVVVIYNVQAHKEI